MYAYFDEKTINKARAGMEFVNIYPDIGGIRVRRKKLKFDEILPYIQKLLKEAYEASYDIIDESIKASDDIDEYINNLLIPQSGYLGKPMTNRDASAYVISKLQEALAILNYMHKL